MKKYFKLLTFLFFSILGASNLFGVHHVIFDTLVLADFEGIKTLIRQDCTCVNCIDEKGVTPLFKLCDIYGSEEDFNRRKNLEKIFLYFLQSTDADVNFIEPNIPNFSVLQCAVQNDLSYDSIASLIEKGARVSYINSFGDSVLNVAENKLCAVLIIYRPLKLSIKYHQENILKLTPSSYLPSFLRVLEYNEKCLIDLQSEFATQSVVLNKFETLISLIQKSLRSEA
ncbi:TPA: hypothetical protein DEO28_03185 [Candidatus Dependentiae bacterium]|nr:MAG: hypothetical protein UR14_C0005G0014 [candidate division TM6 bacterium GW2011_GWE2_31_21]KKP53090.1 MAG: hypothetical protein UR43_C0007G0014 [candidate division TM6 bacterium GW2011_GWF2_33_332]HBS47908.1 hypothetical protein [Candidatus Dependentiae bacterium]HBZ73488.1 hypothetical protein [Candidatus Dependentiae bacterium]